MSHELEYSHQQQSPVVRMTAIGPPTGVPTTPSDFVVVVNSIPPQELAILSYSESVIVAQPPKAILNPGNEVYRVEQNDTSGLHQPEDPVIRSGPDPFIIRLTTASVASLGLILMVILVANAIAVCSLLKIIFPESKVLWLWKVIYIVINFSTFSRLVENIYELKALNRRVFDRYAEDMLLTLGIGFFCYLFVELGLLIMMTRFTQFSRSFLKEWEMIIYWFSFILKSSCYLLGCREINALFEEHDHHQLAHSMASSTL